MTNFKLRLLRTSQLTAAHWQRWDELQTSVPSLTSPYFRPEFTQAVARVRDDVEVGVLEANSSIAGFFPFQRDRLNLGKPVGGKLSDYHGIIADDVTAAAVDPAWLIRESRLSGWDFDHLPAVQQAFAPFATGEGFSRQMDLSQGFEAYVEDRRLAKTDAVKKSLQQERRLERDCGTIRFEPDTKDEGVFELIREWKSAQYARTNLADVFAFPWVTELLQDLRRLSSPQLSLETSALWCGEELAAAMISLRSRHVVHSWFPAYNMKFERYAPGIQVFIQLARLCEERNFSIIDFGTGDERYKKSLGNKEIRTLVGSIEQPSVGIWLRKRWRSTRDLVQNSPWGKVAAVPLRLLQPVREWMAYR